MMTTTMSFDLSKYRAEIDALLDTPMSNEQWILVKHLVVEMLRTDPQVMGADDANANIATRIKRLH